MLAVKARNFYRCTKCENKNIININMVDSALWAVAAPLYTLKMQNKAEGQKEFYEAEIDLLKGKIAVANDDSNEFINHLTIGALDVLANTALYVSNVHFLGINWNPSNIIDLSVLNDVNKI